MTPLSESRVETHRDSPEVHVLRPARDDLARAGIKGKHVDGVRVAAKRECQHIIVSSSKHVSIHTYALHSASFSPVRQSHSVSVRCDPSSIDACCRHGVNVNEVLIA